MDQDNNSNRSLSASSARTPTAAPSPSPLPSLVLRAAKDSGQPSALVQAAALGYAAQIRHMDKSQAAGLVQLELERVAEAYGARGEISDRVFSECTQFIIQKFPGLGVNEIREAYRMKAAGELEGLPKGKGEMYGGVFNADQLGAVLSAYMQQRRRALGAYLRHKAEEMEAAEKQQIKIRQQEEFNRKFPELIAKMKANAKDWRDCPFYLFEASWKRGLIRLDEGEKESIMADAMELASLEAENKYAEAVEAGGLGVFKMRELKKAVDDKDGIERRAKTIARQITLYRKIVLTNNNPL